MRWARIESGRVANVVEQDSKPLIAGEWVECGGAGPGWSYDGSSFTNPGAQDTRPRHITQFAFRSRVTDELVAQMELAAMHNPADAAPAQMSKAIQRARMARAFSATYLNLDDEELRGGFSSVSEEAFNRIFIAEVRDIERP